ncbi:UDP-N-acetylmuramoyl-tripeptide--D-alanyl-D-alanine ligase [Solimonas sp. SE-A11]|uniref:UDP-N-acetylmuramoyl-tripeptide--D-alanyl-D- alanine ligase n=1 Tax=Solimonas sp. SE-A11 TaxID=3054954 RepID=UPI00259CE440|nr:UDP-N-acetylmuramoyl-tripeptide--D-alanyl-D-alanine ligase [Solimonas sp. SE-A11]MDM4770653.1 UDP-N-acetylmuramoyl-tripeptide--D-alanyl-D-alanine ligase [Solimonas sp. SE-A11]
MMDRLSTLARLLNGELAGGDAGFSRVGTDTRTLQPGDLYVALQGENFDGHNFLEAAVAAGAAGALVSRRVESSLPQVVVGDTLKALQEYAAEWRRRFDIPVVAVTGSNGKTTTKQLLASVFAARGPVLATRGNLNNHIGVPLTLLSLRPEHRTAVIEMGANHAGEIALLASLAKPDVGVVTQAGDAHLEGFGSREGVARAKGELFAALSGGVAVINADDHYAPLWRDLARHASVLTFGFDEGADVRALHVQAEPPAAPSVMQFELRAPNGKQSVRLPLPGRHMVANAMAAAACGVALGLDVQQIAQGLAGVDAPSGRLSWKTTPQGARLLDDSYNANPSSLKAGLELLAGMAGRRWAVLGAMVELGPNSVQLHADAGRTARALGIDRLLTLGPMARHAAEAFGTGAEAYDSVEELAAAANQQLDAQTVVLVKGSRSSRMERVVAALTGETQNAGDH